MAGGAALVVLPRQVPSARAPKEQRAHSAEAGPPHSRSQRSGRATQERPVVVRVWQTGTLRVGFSLTLSIIPQLASWNGNRRA